MSNRLLASMRIPGAAFIPQEELHSAIFSYQENRNEQSLKTIISNYSLFILKYIRAAARRFAVVRDNLEDVQQEILAIALPNAVMKFRLINGIDTSFTTILIFNIRSVIRDFCQQNYSIVKGPTSRRSIKVMVELNKLEAMYPPTSAEYANGLARLQEDTGLSYTMLTRLQSYKDRYVSLTSADGSDAELITSELIDNPTVDTDIDISRGRVVLKEFLDTLSVKNRDIYVCRRLMDPPLMLDELGSRHGVSKQRISMIEQRTHVALLRYFDSHKITGAKSHGNFQV